MGHDLSLVAKSFGTPTYVYSFQRIAQKLSLLRDSFSAELNIHYAMKANSNRELLKRLKKLKVGVDVVSGGEIKRALECGFKGQDIIFSGVAKSVDEITFSLDNKIKTFNVESPGELERIGTIAKKKKQLARVSLRINPNVNPKTHPYITTGFRENKFGMDVTFLPELLKVFKKYHKNLELVGLDFHIGSQLLELKPYESALIKSVVIFKNLRAQYNFPLKSFDVGGGIGIPYKNEEAIDLTAYGKLVEKHLIPLQCEILCEPGRFLVGDSGVLLTKVEYIKKTPYKTFVIVNTGMHHLLRPALYSAYHRIFPLKRSPSKGESVDVVGPICESSDWLGVKRNLGQVRENDILALCDVGAYGYVMASDYNLHPRPHETFVD
jgi:diaminopimelate decarboxylase